MVDNDKKDKGNFNTEAFKHALGMVESSGGKNLDNKTSSAAGKYHFLWNLIKKEPKLKGVTKRQFMNNPDLQEGIMDDALNGSLEGYPGYIEYSKKLKSRYNSDLDISKIAALTHFLGSGNVNKYLSDPQSFEVQGKNMSPEEYLGNFDKSFNKYISDNGQPLPSEQALPSQDFRDESMLNQAQDNTNINLPEQNQPTEAPEGMEGRDVDVNSFEMGGDINSEDERVVYFEGGGSHEENPLGGIPQGVGANGKPNLVEEGETKWNDYIFSNSINI